MCERERKKERWGRGGVPRIMRAWSRVAVWFDPTPCALHPSPYTLHPTPYTLHSTPYTCIPRQKHLAEIMLRAVALRLSRIERKREREREKTKERERRGGGVMGPVIMCEWSSAGVRFNPTPYTLHPTTYTLHPTTCILHSTPSTLNPRPYTLNPTITTVQPAPYTLHPS